jgi:predicted phage baseplate assembly protein
VLDRQPGEVLQVEQPNGEYLDWEEVEDFGDSGPDDPHYTLDSVTGTIRFGPIIRDAAGREVQYGAIPPLGAQMRFTTYRTGGGTKGNVGKNTINVMKSTIPYISRATNSDPAIGGEDAESLDQAMLRGPKLLRARSRAVTVEDYEYLSKQATPEVARARCIPPSPEDVTAGRVITTVLLVPASARTDQFIPREELQLGQRALTEVMEYINARRLVTSEVRLAAPNYRYVSVEAGVRARKRANKEELKATIEKKLYTLINPVKGGPDGDGWPWGRSLFHSEIMALIQGVDGVEYVESLQFYVADLTTRTRSRVDGSITCPPDGLLASYDHAVSVK